MFKSGILAADIPLYGPAADAYGAVPPAADAAIWWAYAAAVTLAVFDGILYWAYTSCRGGWFWDLCCVLGYMDWAALAPCRRGAPEAIDGTAPGALLRLLSKSTGSGRPVRFLMSMSSELSEELVCFKISILLETLVMLKSASSVATEVRLSSAVDDDV